MNKQNNGQKELIGKNTNTSPVVPKKNKEPLEAGCDGDLSSLSDSLRGLNKELAEIEKGCGKEFEHNIHDEITICRKEPKGVFIESAQPLTKEGIKNICHSPTYKFALCPECQARKYQLQTDMKIVEELKEKLKEEGWDIDMDYITYKNMIDKLFKEIL
jgi:hypothetical protein